MAKANQQSNKEVKYVVNVAAAKKTAHAIVEAIFDTGNTLRKQLLSLKGSDPRDLEVMKEAFKAEMAVRLKETRLNPEKASTSLRTIYNMNSDVVAAMNHYSRYAGVSKVQQKKWDEAEKKATSYPAFIHFCRSTKDGKGENVTNISTKAKQKKRIESAWKHAKAKQRKMLENNLRYAPTEVLLHIEDFVSDLIAERKRGAADKARGTLHKLETKARKAA